MLINAWKKVFCFSCLTGSVLRLESRRSVASWATGFYMFLRSLLRESERFWKRQTRGTFYVRRATLALPWWWPQTDFRVSMFGCTVTRRTKDTQRPSYRYVVQLHATLIFHIFPYGTNPSLRKILIFGGFGFDPFASDSYGTLLTSSCWNLFARSGIWSRKRKWLVSRSFVGPVWPDLPFESLIKPFLNIPLNEKKNLTRWLAPGKNACFVCTTEMFRKTARFVFITDGYFLLALTA